VIFHDRLLPTETNPSKAQYEYIVLEMETYTSTIVTGIDPSCRLQVEMTSSKLDTTEHFLESRINLVANCSFYQSY
jgi:hypothetical protein